MGATIFKRLAVLCLGCFGLAGGLFAQGGEPHPLAAVTAVLANSDDPASMRLADLYVEARGIPEGNVIALPLSKKGQISRQEFVETLWNPLREKLFERELQIGELLDETDAVGRRKPILEKSRLHYLVILRGVPFRIEEAKGLDDSELFERPVETSNADPERSNGGKISANSFPPQLRKNRASVDSELTLLNVAHTPLTGFLSNPAFNQMGFAETNLGLVRVGRLDGPSEFAAAAMLRNALEAERIGLRGRAYFDLALRKGSYAQGERWIRRASELAAEASFDVTVDENKALFPESARFDAPAIYFGWYAGGVSGPFELPGFRFPPGAIAAHLHSFSAHELRNGDRRWTGPLIEAGVTATVGNVFEPYLEQTHHFDVLLEALLRGANFGDAALAAVPSLSWQTIALGDPLYQPLKAGMEVQLKGLGDPALAASDPYVVLRALNRLETTEADPDKTRMFVLKAFYQTPGPALALRFAEMEAERGDLESAARRLEFAPLVTDLSSQDWTLFAEIAEKLAEWDKGDAGTLVFENIFAAEGMTQDYRLQMLERGAKVARAGGRDDLSVRWLQEVNEIRIRREAAKAAREAKKKK